MGCCFSFFTSKNNNSQDDETTPLLSQYDKTINEHDDIQVILDKFSSNLINIESMESNELTDLEVERLSNLYKKRLKNLDITIPDMSMCLLTDVSTPEAIEILSSGPISLADEQLMDRMLKGVVAALNDIKVVGTEDLVVPFQG